MSESRSAKVVRAGRRAIYDMQRGPTLVKESAIFSVMPSAEVVCRVDVLGGNDARDKRIQERLERGEVVLNSELYGYEKGFSE